jgi:predicted branched-subunit amino acid permease
VRSGFTTSIAIALSTFPFGLAYGVAAAASGLSPWLGASASWTVMAGAAQLSMLSLIERHASWVVVIAAAIVINLRFALYSIALAPAFKDFPPRWRFTLPYVMTDMAALRSLQYFEQQTDPVARRWYYLASSLTIASMWWAGTVAGVVFGAAIPPGIDVGFMVPLAFVVLIAPGLTDRASIAAALAASVATVAVTGLPSGLNTIAGAAAGVAAGALADRLAR